MAQIVIDIPDAALTRVRDAFAARYGYPPFIDGVANPQTKAQFAKAQIADFVKQTVSDYEAMRAAEAARNSKRQEIEAIAIT